MSTTFIPIVGKEHLYKTARIRKEAVFVELLAFSEETESFLCRREGEPRSKAEWFYWKELERFTL